MSTVGAHLNIDFNEGSIHLVFSSKRVITLTLSSNYDMSFSDVLREFDFMIISQWKTRKSKKCHCTKNEVFH